MRPGTDRPRRRTAPAVVLAILAIGALAGCAPSDRATSEAAGEQIPVVTPVELKPGEPLRIVATTSIVGDIVGSIVAAAGEMAQVDTIIGRGVEVHGYEPRPSDIRRMSDAHLVFINGLGLEVTMRPLLDSLSSPVIPLSAAVPDPIPGDPHVWMSPRNVILWVTAIVDVLAHADPVNASNYEDAGRQVTVELSRLDAELGAGLSAVPEEQRHVVTDHSDLGYVARDYGITVAGTLVSGTSAVAEPSARSLAELVATIDADRVNAILVDAAAARSMWTLARTVAAEANREVTVIPILTSSLAPEGEPGDTYAGFIRYNLEALLRAIGGTPEAGGTPHATGAAGGH